MVEVTISDELAARLRAKEHDETTDLSVLVVRAVTTVLEEEAARKQEMADRAREVHDVMAKAGIEVSEEEAVRMVDWRGPKGSPDMGGPTAGGQTPK
jgi:hypothetical protein